MEEKYYDLLVLATDNGTQLGYCAAGESSDGCIVEDSSGNLYKIVGRSGYIGSDVMAVIMQGTDDLISAKAIYRKGWASENGNS